MVDLVQTALRPKSYFSMVAKTQVDPTSKVARDKDDKRTIRDKDDKRTIRDKDGKRTIKDKTHVTADETTADKVITTSKTRTSALRIRVLDFLPENLILLLLFQLPSSQNLCPISPDRNSARHT